MANIPTKTYLSARQLLYAGLILVCIALSAIIIFSMDKFPKLVFMPFLAIVGIITVIIIFARPFAGLMIYLTFLLIRPQEFVPFLMSVPLPMERIIAVILIVSLIVYLKTHHQMKISITGIDVGVFLFISVALLSIITSIWVTGSWQMWNKLLRLAIVFFLTARLINTEGQLKKYVLFVILAAGFHAAAAVIRYYMGIRELEMGIERAIGIDMSYGDPNSLAPTLIYTFPFLYYYFISIKSTFAKISLIALSLVMLWCVILTGSRTGMAGVIFFVLMLIYFNKSRFRNFLIVAIVALAIIPFIPNQYIERFESITDLTSDTGAAHSAHGRITGLTLGLKMMLDRPLFGYGIGNYPIANGLIYTGAYFDSHSLPGQISGELGVLGWLAFGAWIYALFKSLGKLRQYLKIFMPERLFLYNISMALTMELLCLFFMGLAGHNLYRYNWFIISAGVVVLLNITKMPSLNYGWVKEKANDTKHE